MNSEQELGYDQVVPGSVYRHRHDHYLTFLLDNLSAATPLGKILHEEGLPAMVEAMGVTYNHWQAVPWPLDDSLHPTNWIAADLAGISTPEVDGISLVPSMRGEQQEIRP